MVEAPEFEEMVKAAIDNIPSQYGDHIKNLAFVVDDESDEIQRSKLHLVDGQILFGLYEGIPLTKRNNGYNLVLPDKITLFRLPILLVCNSLEEVRAQVKKTVWHEVAHYFGLDHEQIHALEQ